jgi:hypothetical protein
MVWARIARMGCGIHLCRLNRFSKERKTAVKVTIKPEFYALVFGILFVVFSVLGIILNVMIDFFVVTFISNS